MLLQQVYVVQVIGCPEMLAAFGDGLNPVDAVGADRTGAMRVAQQIPAAIPHDDGPRVDDLLPLPARLAAVADTHPALGRDSGNQGARHLRAGPYGPAVGRSGGMLAHDGGLPADVLGQRPHDLAQGGTDRIVGIRGSMAAIEHGHDQAQRFGGTEHQRRQPEAPADSVAAVAPPDRLHGDAGLAQDRDVAACGPFGNIQLHPELGGGDAGLGLQQLESPQRSPGGTQVGFHGSRLIRNPIVRNCA